MIPATQITTCTQGSDDSWLASLLLWTPALAVTLVVIAATPRHHGKFLWLAVPHLALVPWAATFTLPYLTGSTIQGNHLCSVLVGEGAFNDYPVSWWQALWAPLELGLLIALVMVVVRTWKHRTK